MSAAKEGSPISALSGSESLATPEAVELSAQARAMIKEEGVSCVVSNGDEIVYKADGRGVAPLLALYEGASGLLTGSRVTDRIVGKAAAMILVLGRVAAVYGEVMSKTAFDYLTARGIEAQFGRCVDVITGRSGSGTCPLESSVLTIDDPEAGLAALRRTLTELRQAAAQAKETAR